MDQPESTAFDWKAFSQRTWVVVVSGLVFPPLGIFLSWRKTDWAPKAKWIATGLMGLLLLWRMGGSDKKDRQEAGATAQATAEVQQKSAEGSPPLNHQRSQRSRVVAVPVERRHGKRSPKAKCSRQSRSGRFAKNPKRSS